MPYATPDPNAASEHTRSSPLLVVLAWAVVLIPTGWGLNYTIQNAMKIFTAPTPAASSPSTTAPPARP